jgi:hypothetical protein
MYGSEVIMKRLACISNQHGAIELILNLFLAIARLRSLYFVEVILVPAVISAPGIISLTPITTVLVDGNVIVVLVGFWSATSVIMLLCPPGCEATST